MSFSVCLLCSEQPEIVSRFVSYYLGAGAERVSVYLDEGAPCPALPEDPRVSVITCAALLEDCGLTERPRYIEELQVIAYGHAFGLLSSEWMLICDADEFVASSHSIEVTLSHIPDHWHFAILPVAEGVWGPEDTKFEAFGCTYFRTRAPKGFGKIQSRILYGKNGKFLVAGLVGHSLGKYVIRKGSPVRRLGIHEPHGDITLKGGTTCEIEAMSELFLYHFDAISLERWQTKWSGRLEKTRESNAYGFNNATALYARQFEKAKDKKSQMQLFSSLYAIGVLRTSYLKAVGQLRRKKLWQNQNEGH